MANNPPRLSLSDKTEFRAQTKPPRKKSSLFDLLLGKKSRQEAPPQYSPLFSPVVKNDPANKRPDKNKLSLLSKNEDNTLWESPDETFIESSTSTTTTTNSVLLSDFQLSPSSTTRTTEDSSQPNSPIVFISSKLGSTPEMKLKSTSSRANPRKNSRISIDDFEARERRPSLTSIDSVYSVTTRDDAFEIGNPILLPQEDSSGNLVVNQSQVDLDEIRAKRTSLSLSAGAHIDTSKLLERRHTRHNHKNTPLNPGLYERDTHSAYFESKDSFSYERDAFSNPESDFTPQSPAATQKQLPEVKHGSDRSLPVFRSTRPSLVETARRESSHSETRSPRFSISDSSDSPLPQAHRPSLIQGGSAGGLRAKRANSKLIHDKGNYSTKVLSQIEKVGPNLSSRFRTMELTKFFDHFQNDPRSNWHNKKELTFRFISEEKAEFLLQRYSVQELVSPLFKLYSDVPKGWECYLPFYTQYKLKRARNEPTDLNTAISNLDNNLKTLFGEKDFVAHSQIARFNQARQVI